MVYYPITGNTPSFTHLFFHSLVGQPSGSCTVPGTRGSKMVAGDHQGSWSWGNCLTWPHCQVTKADGFRNNHSPYLMLGKGGMSEIGAESRSLPSRRSGEVWSSWWWHSTKALNTGLVDRWGVSNPVVSTHCASKSDGELLKKHLV